MSSKTKVTTVVLATCALAGTGVSSAATANALSFPKVKMTAYWSHNSAHYGSATTCNKNRNGSIARIDRYVRAYTPRGRWATHAEGYCHKVRNYWTYDGVTYGYLRGFPAIPGDKVAYRWS